MLSENKTQIIIHIQYQSNKGNLLLFNSNTTYINKMINIERYLYYFNVLNSKILIIILTIIISENKSPNIIWIHIRLVIIW